MKISEAWIRHQIKLSIRNNLNEGILSTIGAGIDAIAPDWLVKKPLKGLLFRRVSKKLGFNPNSTIGMFVQSVLEDINFETAAKIYSGEIECEELTPVVAKVASDTITKIGVKKLLMYILQHYDVQELANSIISFGGSGNKKDEIFNFQSVVPSKTELITSNQANQILNSLIGSYGTSLVEKLVFNLVEEHIVPKLVDIACNMDKEDIQKLDKDIGIGPSNEFADNVKSLSDGDTTDQLLKIGQSFI